LAKIPLLFNFFQFLNLKKKVEIVYFKTQKTEFEKKLFLHKKNPEIGISEKLFVT